MYCALEDLTEFKEIFQGPKREEHVVDMKALREESKRLRQENREAKMRQRTKK